MFVQVVVPSLPYGPIKIEGVVGQQLAPRLTKLTEENAFELLLIGLIPSDDTENDLNMLTEMFANSRMHHSWFEPDPELISLIANRAQDAITALLAQTHPGAMVDAPVDIDEISEILGVSTKTVRRMVKAEQIPYLRWGRTLRFIPADVLATLRRQER
jgi:excisionase family DNA binding protein